MIDYKSLNINKLINLLKKADDKYYNVGDPFLTDNEYDEIREYAKKLDENNKYFKNIGAEIKTKNKVELPFFLGSLDKIKDDEKTLNKWINKYNNPSSYVISEKLDGISCLVYYNNSKINIYTRGNGIYGQNITHLKDYIIGIPTYNDNKQLAVRGELIISKKNWLNFSDKWSNARNFTAGIVNSKVIDKNVAKYIEFIAYDVLYPRTNIQTALEYAKTLNFNIVKYIVVNKINDLYELFKNWKIKSKYEIDGIVITHNDIYEIKSGENPKYSFAFKSLKMQEEAEIIVKEVEWNISKDKYLKPIIKFDEIKLNGVKIKQATGFNANYIVENNIGIGSKLIIIRSGDVIPHIKEVISTNGKPALPKLNYIWKGKDIILNEDIKNREQDIKIYTNFMKSLNIKGIGEGIITKLYDNSFDTLFKIINITKQELLNIDGFKEKSSSNLIESLKLIKTKNCIELMSASNLMGRGMGEKKLQLIIDVYPFICKDQEKALKITIDDLMKINGLGKISSLQFIENLHKFYEFYNLLIDNKDEIEDEIKDDNKDEIKINNKYKNNIYVFTGVRDKNLEKIIIASGGKISSTISKKTTLLIVKDININSSKIKTAKELNIPIMNYNEFIKIE